MIELTRKYMQKRDYYKILLVSQTGKGKTYSFRDMDPDTTGFINAENKPLPFQNNFKFCARPTAFAGCLKALQDYAANPDITCIVIDSLSAVMELLVDEMRSQYKGFDIWSNYNIKLSTFLKEVKAAQKEIFLTAHYETLNIEGSLEKRVKTKGKEFEGVIEREFTMVMYTDCKFKDEKPQYFFQLAGEGISAKVPPGIFGEGVLKVDNNSQMVLDKVLKFTNIGEPV